jgi:catalase
LSSILHLTLPDDLAQVLLEHAAAYPVVVRFSNPASLVEVDAIPDGRGMAIKVLEVTGDVVLATSRKARHRIYRGYE